MKPLAPTTKFLFCTSREVYRDYLTPQVENWPTILQTDDILIKDIP